MLIQDADATRAAPRMPMSFADIRRYFAAIIFMLRCLRRHAIDAAIFR